MGAEEGKKRESFRRIAGTVSSETRKLRLTDVAPSGNDDEEEKTRHRERRCELSSQVSTWLTDEKAGTTAN